MTSSVSSSHLALWKDWSERQRSSHIWLSSAAWLHSLLRWMILRNGLELLKGSGMMWYSWLDETFLTGQRIRSYFRRPVPCHQLNTFFPYSKIRKSPETLLNHFIFGWKVYVCLHHHFPQYFSAPVTVQALYEDVKQLLQEGMWLLLICLQSHKDCVEPWGLKCTWTADVDDWSRKSRKIKLTYVQDIGSWKESWTLLCLLQEWAQAPLFWQGPDASLL